MISSGNYRPFWVDDMKTPSGFAHIGSLRGPLIHSLIFRSLKDAGEKATFTFVINDFDPIDELPADLSKSFAKYMGVPLRLAPSPREGYKSYAEYFTADFKKNFEDLGIEAKLLCSWDMYREGKFDGVIKTALDSAEKIQDIYQKVSGSKKKEEGWLPFQVVCENCGKLGTTKVYAWDGKEVSYRCEPNLVTWAKGCGHEGKVSPFTGTGKLPWKVDWPAHWKVIGVTIEGAGKDHASAGGSYDIAMALCDEVFHYPRPYKLPYEFFLVGGKKMSSSKGLGLKAHDLVKILPAEIGRFVFARTNHKEQIEFEPVGTMAISDLFDEYDEAWQAHITGSDENLARSFVLSQISKVPPKTSIYLPRFRDVANYLQQPDVNLSQKFEEEKGSDLTTQEKKILKEREKYARVWLENNAPPEFKEQMSEELPAKVKSLDKEQKSYLLKVVNLIEKAKAPDDLQKDLFALSKELGLNAKKAFAAIYLAFIGRDHGPRAAWFLLQYPKEKVVTRLKEAAK